MTEAQPVKFGPFTGGMNTYSDPSGIADSEAVFIENFDVDIDGSLVSRPPFHNVKTDSSLLASRMLGTYRGASADYAIYSNASSTYAVNLSTFAVTLITTTFAASACVQYDNKIWLVAPVGSANPGGSWNGTSFTAVASMPKGNSCCIYKERMYIGQGVGGTATLYFSQAADPGAAWNAADFLFVNKGDGQDLVDIRVFNNVIVVFKEASTYIFAYDTAPTRGTVQMVSSTVGVLAPNCVVDYENSIFVLHENIVYQVQNWNFDPINIKVPFTYLNATPAAMAQPRGLSVLYDRLFVRYYDKTYVYHMKTRGWVEWTSSYTPAVFVKIPDKDPGTGASEFVAVSCLNNVDDLFRFTDTIATGKGDEPAYTCRLITKTHAMEVPYTFKRLMWWGLDGFPKTDLTAKVSPVSYGRAVTWNQVATKKWNELGTWSRLLDISIDVTDSAEFGASSNTRSFIKFIRSLRFRQIYFTIETQVTGQPSDSPFRIYFIMAITANKQVVSAKVN